MTHWEAHITVCGRRPQQFHALCKELGVKPVDILLLPLQPLDVEARKHGRQLMCTLGGELEEGVLTPEKNAINAAQQIALNLVKRGHRVERVKVEREIMQEPKVQNGVAYYEMHAKIVGKPRRMENWAWTDLLYDMREKVERVAEKTGTAASQSLLTADDETYKFFFTDRIQTALPARAEKFFQDTETVLRAEVAKLGGDDTLVAIEREAVLLDTYPDMDFGWADTHTDDATRSRVDPRGNGWD